MKKAKTRFGASALSGAFLALAGGQAAAMELGAFADASYVSSDVEGVADGFAFGDLDLYTAQKISDNTKAFFEVLYENEGDEFELDIERYWVTREFSEAFSLGAGRFHSPLGYWNRNYHHGILIQDTVSRPGFLEFEHEPTGILPMHIIGLMATGRLGGGFNYEAALANSSSYDTNDDTSGGALEIANLQDQSDDKSLFGRLNYDSPDHPFHVGLFVMTNNLVASADDSDPSDGIVATAGEDLIRQTVAGLDFRYRHDGFDVLAELYRLDNDAEAGVGDAAGHSAEAYYIQAGYRFKEKWKAVYRFESLDFDDDDAYFDIVSIGKDSPMSPEERDVFVIRYEMDDSNALMLEVNSRDPDAGASVTTTTLNWSFLLF